MATAFAAAQPKNACRTQPPCLLCTFLKEWCFQPVSADQRLSDTEEPRPSFTQTVLLKNRWLHVLAKPNMSSVCRELKERHFGIKSDSRNVYNIKNTSVDTGFSYFTDRHITIRHGRNSTVLGLFRNCLADSNSNFGPAGIILNQRFEFVLAP